MNRTEWDSSAAANVASSTAKVSREEHESLIDADHGLR